MLQQVVVSNFNEIDKHGTFPFGLIGNQDFEIQFKLAINIVDVVFSQSNGMIQHVFKFGQNIGYLSDYHC